MCLLLLWKPGCGASLGVKGPRRLVKAADFQPGAPSSHAPSGVTRNERSPSIVLAGRAARVPESSTARVFSCCGFCSDLGMKSSRTRSPSLASIGQLWSLSRCRCLTPGRLQQASRGPHVTSWIGGSPSESVTRAHAHVRPLPVLDAFANTAVSTGFLGGDETRTMEVLSFPFQKNTDTLSVLRHLAFFT